ncbi:MAG: adenylate/guanylate cyclase domain-containing protein [Leptospiraceae bacterium]|nr:adenylate/guanylate cyclase domain-containing protein [Leptospiraceae bacterium]MCP5486359.1 adenylate/guanylate cyclase domain-containing protein [Spirochaetales bacterium]
MGKPSLKITELTLDSALAHEVIKGERLRCRILLSIFAFGLTAWTIAFLFFRAAIEEQLGGRFPFGVVIVALAVATAYELFLQFALTRAIRSRRHFPEFGRFINAFVETSLPTAILFFAADVIGPIPALYAPGFLIYFAFIMLSIVRLRFGLSVFTSLVAAVEYGLLAYYLTNLPDYNPDLAPTYLTARPWLVARCVLLAAAGVVAGFVSSELAKRLQASVNLLRERDDIVGLFGQYVSPQVVDRLLSQRLDLPAEMRHVCILFLDIRNFTGFSEHRSPAEVIEYLNALFAPLIDIVNQHNGIVNKFLGDGFMAVFGAPISDENGDVRNAVRAARAISARVQDLVAQGIVPETRIGIGIHAGEAMTGNVGSNDRKEYTIIGDIVNLASRVEALNKEYGSTVLVTEAVASVIADREQAHRIAEIPIRGRKQPVAIYRLV